MAYIHRSMDTNGASNELNHAPNRHGFGPKCLFYHVESQDIAFDGACYMASRQKGKKYTARKRDSRKEQKVEKRCCMAPAPFHSMLANPVTPSLVYKVFCEKKLDTRQPYFPSVSETPRVDWVTWPNPPESTTWYYRGESVGFNGEMVAGGTSGLEEHLQELEYQSTA